METPSRVGVVNQNPLTYEALAKLPIDNNCHSERSEESRIFKRLRSFTSFRMTEKNTFARGSRKSEKTVNKFPCPPPWHPIGIVP
jgi:hypothetical protein